MFGPHSGEQVTLTPYNLADSILLDIPEVTPAESPQTLMAHIEETVLLPSPETVYFDRLIDQKQAEVGYLKRQYLPQIQMYFNYNLYGFHPEQYWNSVTDLQNRSLYTGINITLPLFDGFKTLAQIKKAKLEVNRLKLQKEQKLAELALNVKNQVDLLDSLTQSAQHKEKIVMDVHDKVAMVNRLTQQELLAQSDRIKAVIDQLNRDLEWAQTKSRKAAAAYKLQVLVSP